MALFDSARRSNSGGPVAICVPIASWPPIRATEPLASQCLLPQLRVRSLLPAAATPGVVSLPLQITPPTVTQFEFPSDAQANWLAAGQQPGDPLKARTAASEAAGDATGMRQRPRHTRVRPPADVVKLQDRLRYVLQPPLECIIRQGGLTFPFEPFDYQLEGIAFLYPRQHAVLADEMGLGKTMQAISAIRLLIHSRQVRRVLLVCPKPLVSNWQREFAFWADELPVQVIGGSAARRRWQWQLADSIVNIANYELLIRDRDVLSTAACRFDLVVLDEAQRIKNLRSTTSEVVRSIHRGRSWALTGTPVENSSEDLVGIFEFLMPGYLRTGMKPRALGRAIGDSVLRRTKENVLSDLPPKIYRDARLDLTPQQQESYRIAEDEGVVRLGAMGDQLTVQHVFELILRLKQICNFDPLTGASAKFERLQADLEECAASGRKAIVFSQWVQTLEQIRDRLGPLKSLEYHGRLPARRRDRVLQQFEDSPQVPVLLMSYGAGSVGLNLQFCRYVFLFDRWWNPAVEDQAINRAHRIGAAGSVTVTRFCTLGTIEERIDQILEDKRELAAAILSGQAQSSRISISREEIFDLFQLPQPSNRRAA